LNAPAQLPRSRPAGDEASRPLKVVHLIHGLGVGGAETWLMELVRYWRARDAAVETHFVATGGQPDVFDDEARALGAQIHYLRYGRRDLPSFVAGFRRLLKQGRFDALHDHQDYASGWHYLMGLGVLPPVRVTHVHNPAYQIRNNYGVTLGRRLTAQAGKRLAARYATHIAGTSRAAITAFGFDAPAFAATPKAALYCGFDASRFAASETARNAVREEFGWPADVAVVLFAGRFDVSADPGHAQTHKNSGFAVDVAIECARRSQRVRFVFAGPFSQATPILRQRIDAAGLTDQIAFAGVRKDIGRLMAGADALLFPSRAEGLGLVAVEAQAAGLPVLASTQVPHECVVIPELVRFRNLDDGVSAWAGELCLALDRSRMDPIAANRRVAASPFAIAHSAAALERLYRDGALA
jgi:glycosyltransferase involved in cell wall biosynthesis